MCPIFCPKLGAGHKQKFSPTQCVLKTSTQLTKGGRGEHAAILHTILG